MTKVKKGKGKKGYLILVDPTTDSERDRTKSDYERSNRSVYEGYRDRQEVIRVVNWEIEDWWFRPLQKSNQKASIISFELTLSDGKKLTSRISRGVLPNMRVLNQTKRSEMI